MMRLKDKVAIVTGAAKGLGREFAIGMAKEGAKIMVVTRKDLAKLSPKAVDNTVDELSSKTVNPNAQRTFLTLPKNEASNLNTK